MSHNACRQCKTRLAPAAIVCPHCGLARPAWQAVRPFPSMLRVMRANGLLYKIIGAIVVAMILTTTCSLVTGDVDYHIAALHKKRNLVADRRELLLHEQQRLNLPDAASLNQPPSTANTRLPPARDNQALLDGIGVIAGEVGSRSRYRQAQAQAQIDALHLEDQLLPENLLGPEGIRSGRANNRRYLELLNYSVGVSRASQAEFEQRLRALIGENPEGRQVMTDFVANTARLRQEDTALLKNQRASIAKSEQVLDLAQARLGKIQMQDGTMIFEDPKDAEQFNRLIAEIKSLAEQRTLIERQRQVRMHASLQVIQKSRPPESRSDQPTKR
ncbi:hypothetical protein [Pseudomonas sp. CGJS7]|uniref:hypothetical protein n=1 Tax=Pseudomonas sp. CGJS7 TaxID=3109348 RepID=UPI0030092015